MIRWEEKLLKYEPGRVEIGNIWSYGNNLHLLTKDFVSLLRDHTFDTIATIETKGIIYASAVASELSIPLIFFRKRGKIFYTENKYHYEFKNWKNENDGIEIEKDQLNNAKNILVMDDLTEKLNTFKAVHSIVNYTDCNIVAFLCFVNISGKDELFGKKILSLVKEPKY